MQVTIEASWKEALEEEFSKPYFPGLVSRIKADRAAGQTIYPPGRLIFNAFNLCPLQEVRLVVIGQDPYHGPGQAMGLSFSVPPGIAIPPSLLNIYKEMESDLGIPRPATGDLTAWAKQGVLLLNAGLTVLAGRPNSHADYGWHHFTDAVIKTINRQLDHVVFLLWGKFAVSKSAFIDANRHCVLTAPHPSPFSADRGFFGCRHFSKANAYLQTHGKKTIDWRLP